MPLSPEEKEIKKEFASYKRKVVEIAGIIHDIVEDTIWVDYDKLPGLSEKLQVAMSDVTAFKAKHSF